MENVWIFTNGCLCSSPSYVNCDWEITLLKAIAQKDDGAVKKAQNILIRKTIAAVAVFLVITVTRVALSLVASDAQGQKGNWEECASCFLSPGDCK